MKVRIGFISNSSSSSFVAGRDCDWCWGYLQQEPPPIEIENNLKFCSVECCANYKKEINKEELPSYFKKIEKGYKKKKPIKKISRFELMDLD